MVLVKGRHWPLDDLIRRGGPSGLGPAEVFSADADRSYSGELVDMDGDGDLDIVVSNDRPDPKRIYLNDGAGRFTEESRFGAPEWSTRHVAVADLNADGAPDVIVANRNPEGTDSMVCFGTGDGRLTEPCIPVSHGSATTLTPADMDGDGDPDLIVPHRDGGQSFVLLNDGTGTFPESVPFGPSDAAIRSAKAADFDGDGRMDIVVIAGAQGPAILHGRRDGGWGEPRALPDDGARTYALHVADVDGNGRPDVVVGYVESPAIVFFNDGPDRWTPVVVGDGEGVAYGFATGDVDRDGFIDLAIARSDATNLLFYGTGAAATRSGGRHLERTHLFEGEFR